MTEFNEPAAIPKLKQENGRLHAQLEADGDWQPVKIVYLRPLTARSEVSFINDEGDEVAYLSSVDLLDESSHNLATDSLQQHYFLPKITQVHKVSTTFGTHYWSVETNCGEREFALKEPGKNVTWLGDDHLIIRDTLGNQLEIPSLSHLDEKSRSRTLSVL